MLIYFKLLQYIIPKNPRIVKKSAFLLRLQGLGAAQSNWVRIEYLIDSASGALYDRHRRTNIVHFVVIKTNRSERLKFSPVYLGKILFYRALSLRLMVQR